MTGLVIGSFLNVCIYRIPREESIVFPGSHCPQCAAPLKWYHNIPVVSYLSLRGKCGFCGHPISPVYPLVELITGAISLALFLKFGPSVTFIALFLFCAALVTISFVDLEHRIVPDVISLPGIAAGLLFSLLRPDITFLQSLLGAAIGGGSLLAVIYGYYLLTKREGMGMGDVKLLAMIGAFLGWKSILFVILCSSFAGALVGLAIMALKRKNLKFAIPFGPFLSFGAIFYLFFGEQLVRWYLGTLGVA